MPRHVPRGKSVHGASVAQPAPEDVNRLMVAVEALGLIDEGLIVFDAEGRITFANPAACAYLGVAPVRGGEYNRRINVTALRDAAAGQAFSRGEDPWSRALAGERVEVDCVSAGRQPHEVYLRVSAIPRRDEWGEVVGAVASIVNRTDAYARLRESEGRLRLVSHTFAAAVAIRDAQGRVLYANHGLAQMYGMSPDELQGKTMPELLTGQGWRFFDEDGGELAVQDLPILVALRTRQSRLNVLMGVQKPSGERRWLKADNVVVPDAGGGAFAVVSSMVDVTDLKFSEDRLQQTYDAAVCGLLVRDRDQRIIRLNRAAAEMVGVDREALLGTTGYWTDFEIQAESGKRLELKELPTPLVFREGIPIAEAALLLKRPAHPPRWFQVGAAPVRGPDGQVEQVISSWIDITERKEAEGSARAAAERWRQLVEAIEDGVITTDLDGRIVVWNKAAERIFGWTEAEVQGGPPPFVPDGDAELYQERAARVLAGETIVHESTRIARDGHLIPIASTLSPMVAPDGTVTGILGVVRDITLRQQVHEQARLLAVYEERQRIAMDLHDDVVQLLYALRLQLSAAAHVSKDEPNDVIRAVSDGINTAIQSIRDYVSGLHVATLEGTGLGAQLRSIAQGIGGSVKVNLRVTSAAEVEGLIGIDATANILLIAREAMSNISRHAQASEVSIQLAIADSVLLEIRDNGIGFDLRKAGRRLGDGTRNMRKRAQALGGTLNINSTIGQGTTVLLEFPVS